MRVMRFLPIVYIGTSLLVAIIVGLDQGCPDKYSNVYILPLFLGIVSIVFCNMLANSINNLVVFIVITTYYIKNVVAILILSIGNYYATISDFTHKEVNSAILLMTFETFSVFLYLNIKYRKNNIITKPDNTNNFTEEERLSFASKAILIVIVVAMIAMWHIEPTISENYISILDTDISQFSSVFANQSVARGTLGRICLSVFLMAFSIVRVVYPILIFRWIRDHIRPVFAALALSFVVVLMQLFFITSETAEVILIEVLMIFALIKMYPSYSKQISVVSFGFGGMGVLLLFLGKSSDDLTLLEKLSSLFQSYFPGVTNLAGVFKISVYDKIPHILSDLYTMVPFRNSLFSYEAAEKTVTVFTNANNASGSIIPFIGEMYLYIGYLAPLVILLVINIALWFYRKALEANTLLEYIVYLYISIFFSIAPVMYHITILGQRITNTFIPLLILCAILKQRREKNV